MKLSTTENLDSRQYEILGIIQGSVVQSANEDAIVVGGEIPVYTEILEEAREIATQRLIQNANKVNADAVVCVRYSTSSITQGAAELLAYGTAVRFI